MKRGALGLLSLREVRWLSRGGVQLDGILGLSLDEDLRQARQGWG